MNNLYVICQVLIVCGTEVTLNAIKSFSFMYTLSVSLQAAAISCLEIALQAIRPFPAFVSNFNVLFELLFPFVFGIAQLAFRCVICVPCIEMFV